MAMSNQIKNPVEWGAQRLVSFGHKLGDTGRALHVAEEAGELPAVRKIGFGDLREALRLGLDDLGAFRSDIFSLAIIYPVAGIVLAAAAATNNLLPLVFPLLSGFALVGPVAGIGFYALSRRREREAEGKTAAETPPAYGGMIVVGVFLAGIFLAWLIAAYAIYLATLGPEAPVSTAAFISDVFTTGAGWAMIVIGNAAGFCFAVAALAIGAISFPLMLDRPVGPKTAMRTSIRAVRENPGPMLAWGAIVAAGLVLGSLPALLGLVLVIPLLGHSTWHLYRRLVG